MPIYKNPITIVQGAPTPSADYPTQTYFEPTSSVPSVVTKSGNYFSTNENVAHCHLLKQDGKTIVTVRQSTMNEFRVIVKFKTPLNYAGAIFGGNLGGWECPYGVVQVSGNAYIAYTNTSSTEYRVTAESVIEANKWYYISSTFYKDQKLVCLGVYDENGSLLFAGAKAFVGNLYDNGAKTFLIGGIGSNSGQSPAKDFNIDLDETLLELDNEILWGAANAKTQNMGIFHFDDWSEFTEVGWIESTGTQYIDTEYRRNSSLTKFEIDYYTTDNAGSTGSSGTVGPACLFGDENTSTDRFTIRYHLSQLIYYSHTSGAKNLYGTVSGNNKIIADIENNKITVNDTDNTIQGYSYPAASKNTFIFAQQGGGSGSVCFAKYRLYGFKIYETSLVRNFVPCYHTATGIIGLFDRVNNKFYTNAGTGEFIIPQDINDYQEVEYIESTGTQYINTGYIPTSSTGIQTTIRNLSLDSTDFFFIGCRITNGARFAIGYYQGNFDFGYGSGAIFTDFSYAPDTDYILEMNYLNSSKVKCNESQANITNTFQNIGYPIFLGNVSYSGSVTSSRSYKFKETKISEGTDIVMDLIPCYHKDTGVIGMFDKINDKFYSNAGTGDFIKGPDVNI